MERWFAPLGVGILLVALGAAIPLAAFNRDVVNEYSVGIIAPTDLPWTVWLPMPLTPMRVEVQGTGAAVGVINTSRGSFYNVTGSGNSSVSGSSQRAVFDLSPLEWASERVDLSGSQTDGFWVHRITSDPTATIEVFGGASWSATHLGGSISCGGPGFRGSLEEGWNLVGRLASDCSQLIDGVPWLVVAAVAGSFGVACVGLAAVSYVRRHRQGGQVFVPPST